MQRTMLLAFYNSFFGDWPDVAADAGDLWEVTLEPRRFPDADALVFHLPTLDRPLELEKPAGQRWVAYCMESAVTVPELRDRAFMEQFDLTMTYEQTADVWAAYIGPKVAAELLTPPRPKDAAWPVARFQSNPYDKSGRNAYAAELMRRVKVASYGTVMPTIPNAGTIEGRRARLEVMSTHKFTLAFENSIAEDYVTEKLYEPLIAGSVPVYLGAPNVADFAPAPASIIDVTQFAGPTEVAAYLNRLDRHPDEYARHLAWKRDGFSPQFERLLERALSPRPFRRLAALIRERRR